MQGLSHFLTLLYVESIVCDKFEVQSRKRALQKWTLDLLRRRQNIELDDGGLGCGIIRANASERERFNSYSGIGAASQVHADADIGMRKEDFIKVLDKKITELDFSR